MGKIQGQPFGLVVSKTPQDALTESKKAGNEAKFYVHRSDQVLDGAISDGAGDGSKACDITINGNVIRGLSAEDRLRIGSNLENLKDQVEGLKSQLSRPINYKGTVADKTALDALTDVKDGDMYNVESAIKIDGKEYPAYTNFVYIGTKPLSDEKIWDSLGGVSLKMTLSERNQALFIDETGIGLDIATALKFNSHDQCLDIRCGDGLYVNEQYGLSIELADISGLIATGQGLCISSNSCIKIDEKNGLYPQILDGLDIIDDQLTVKPGLAINTDDGAINVSYGNGLEVTSDIGKLQVKTQQMYSGLICDNNGLRISTGNSINVSEDGKVYVEVGQCLSNNGGINIITGMGLTKTDNGIKVLNGDGLNFDVNRKLQINLSTNNSGGLSINNLGQLVLNIGTGLEKNGSDLTVRIGSGLTSIDGIIEPNVGIYTNEKGVTISTAIRKYNPTDTSQDGLIIALAKHNTTNNLDVANNLIKSGPDGLYISSSVLAQFIRNVMSAK